MVSPDKPGWWAFDGHELIKVCIYEFNGVLYEGWQEEWYEDKYWRDKQDYWWNDRYGEEPKANGHTIILGDPLQTLLELQWVKTGRGFATLHGIGPYKGEPVLGFLHPKYRWSYNLCSVDTLKGEWTRVMLPWENRQSNHV